MKQPLKPLRIVQPADLVFVAGVNQPDVLARCLAASHCFVHERYPLRVHFNEPSAASVFNTVLKSLPPTAWAIWVHQDVVLPTGWPDAFIQQLNLAIQSFSGVAVAGVYGVSGHGMQARRAGHVLDRGELRKEPLTMPCAVDSLDELLVAVHAGSGIAMDPRLGFDFYATDLVMEARSRGLTSVAVDAFCEHWSDTPASGPVSDKVLHRIAGNAEVFEKKWADSLPVTTPCFEINAPGDVARFLRQFSASKE